MKVRFLTDEDVDHALVRGLRRRVHDIDIIRIQDVGLLSRNDSTVLQWAADAGRVLVSHDLRTMSGFAYARVEAGLPMPGVFLLRGTLAIGVMIDELALIAETSEAEEWVNRVVHLPLA